MTREISALKEEYDSIPIPPELDRHIELAIRRGRRARDKGRLFRSLAAAIIFLFFGFTLCVNLSPAFAAYFADMGLESLVKLFSFDQGLANIIKRGFSRLPSHSVTDKGITLTVESTVYDGRKLILAIKIESNLELDSIWLKDPRLRGFSGITKTSWAGPDTGENSRVYWQFLEYEINTGDLQDELFFECTEIDIGCSTPEGYKRETISGYWSIALSPDSDLAEYEPIEIMVNKTVSMGEIQFTVESVDIYPTVIDVKISLDQKNPVRVAGFYNPRLIDGEGHEYTFKSSAGRGTNRILSFESAYFAGTGDLTLALDGIYTLPLSETYFIIDIDNETVLDDGGYGIEFLGKNLISYAGEGEYLEVWFKPTDEEYEAADNRFLWIDHRVHDLSGNPYDITFLSTCVNDCNQYGIGFDVSKEVPAAVKVKITGISKGIMKPLRIKLN